MMTDTAQKLRDAVMATAHHYHCRDTGCFDGDDIALPELSASIDLLLRYTAAEARVDALAWALPHMSRFKNVNDAFRAAQAALAEIVKEAK